MGHTGPRTNASVLNYHIGVFNQLFTLTNGVWVYHGDKVTPAIASDLGDMLGGLNSAYAAQYGSAPFPTDPDSGAVTPPSGDAGAAIKAAPSQWAKNLDRTDAEYQWCVDNGYWTDADRHRITNWWHDNGVKGRYDAATGRYLFYTYPGGVETENVDEQTSASGGPVKGKADEATEAVVGQVIPSPYLP